MTPIYQVVARGVRVAKAVCSGHLVLCPPICVAYARVPVTSDDQFYVLVASEDLFVQFFPITRELHRVGVPQWLVRSDKLDPIHIH